MLEKHELGKWTLPELECKKCGYIWSPRTNNRPKVCPICKRTNWDEDVVCDEDGI